MTNQLIELEEVELLLKDHEIYTKSLTIRKNELKAEIAALMRVAGIRTQASPNNKVLVMISNKKTLRFDDENTVRTYLQSNGLFEECIRLDLETVKRYAKAREIPGMKEEESEVVTVKYVKDKVQAIEPEESQDDFAKRVREGV